MSFEFIKLRVPDVILIKPKVFEDSSIPAGFAHGFEVLSESAVVIYHLNAVYSKKSEAGIIWNDPIINVNWPLKIRFYLKKINCGQS